MAIFDDRGRAAAAAAGQAAAPFGAPTVPPDTRVFAIGDIHGRLDLLRSLHDKIRRAAARGGETRQIVIHLGDYVDRGPQSAQVVEYLMGDPIPEAEVVNLRGNHEDMMIDAASGPRAMMVWLSNGGRATFESYGAATSEILLMRDPEDLCARLNVLPPVEHWSFLKGLPYSYEVGDYFFVHAGVKPGVPLDRQSRSDMSWIRGEFLNSDEDHGKVVVHGHTPRPTPDVKVNRIGIDTGAFYTGRLTCLMLSGGDREFLSA